METSRSVVLTERQCTVCHLDDRDAEFLFAHHRPHLEMRPTRERNMFQIRPRGYVGTINTLHTRITIRPKIPLQNLCYLLDVMPPKEIGDDRTELADGDYLINLLALRLAQLMAESASAGLHRSYIERREQSAFVHGKIDVAEQLRSNPARKDRLACQFEDFAQNNFVNQLPKATAEWLIRNPFVTDGVRQQLRHALTGFHGVTGISLPVTDFTSWLDLMLPRSGCGPLLCLCRLLLEGLNASPQAGATAYPSFLFNLEQAFEHFCTRQLADSFTNGEGESQFYLRSQETVVPHIVDKALPEIQFRPDILISPYQRLAPLLLVIDVKWKRSPFVPADLHQILSYCAVLGLRQGMLIYPGSRNRIWRYQFPSGDKTILIQQLRLTGDLAACRRATERLLRYVHHLCKKSLPKRSK